MDELKQKELKLKVAEIVKGENAHQAIAQLIVEWMQPNHLTTDLMNMLLSTRALNEGDQLLKKVRKGMKVRSFVKGSMPLREEITVDERMNYTLDQAIISVNAGEMELMSGELGTIAEIKAEMQKKLVDHYINKVFTALSSIWTASNTPSNYTDCGGAVTSTALINAIDYLNTITPRAKVIVGVRAALQPIAKFGSLFNTAAGPTWASQSTLDEVMRTGWLGTFYGVPVLALDQIYDSPVTHKKLLPEDKILVIGENVGEFITYGPTKTQEYTDMRPVPPEWIFHLYQQFGMIIDNAQGIATLKVS